MSAKFIPAADAVELVSHSFLGAASPHLEHSVPGVVNNTSIVLKEELELEEVQLVGAIIGIRLFFLQLLVLVYWVQLLSKINQSSFTKMLTVNPGLEFLRVTLFYNLD